MLTKGNLIENFNIKNSIFNENIYRLKKDDILVFPKNFKNWNLVAIHAWNTCNKPWKWPQSCRTCSDIVVKNDDFILVKTFSYNNQVLAIFNTFKLDENTKVNFNIEKLKITEPGGGQPTEEYLEYIDVVAFLLLENLDDSYLNEIGEREILNEYDFTYLINDAITIKEIIDEWDKAVNKNLVLKLENHIKTLEQELKFGTATQRIHNHLDYKLGQIIIRNSKSLFGYIKLPFLLIAMTLAHKEQEKAYKEKIKANWDLALPPLESYKDYKEALKEKECLTYKLGSAFIKAYKSWYKGGMIKFYFEAKRLEREFKGNKV